MDLGTMEEKIERGEYNHMDEFERDFLLVTGNSMKFNPPGTLYHGEAKKLQAWGSKAITREGLSISDNGRAAASRSSQRLQDESVSGVELPRLRSGRATSSSLRERSGFEASRPLSGGGVVGQASAASGQENGQATPPVREEQQQQEAPVEQVPVNPLEGFSMGMDFGDDDEDDEENNAGLQTPYAKGRRLLGHFSRERSLTADVQGGGSASLGQKGSRLGNVAGGSRPGGAGAGGPSCPSTPASTNSPFFRQASPESLRKRLAMVTGTPLSGNAGGGGSGSGSKASHSSKVNVQKAKVRLGPGLTPALRQAAFLSHRSDKRDEDQRGSVQREEKEKEEADRAASNPTLYPTAIVSVGKEGALSGGLPPPPPFHQALSGVQLGFLADGSIDGDEVEDLSEFVGLVKTDRIHLFVPTLESIHPVPFIPITSSSSTSKKEKAKERETEKEKEEKAKEKEKAKERETEKEKEEQDPCQPNGLPPLRAGAPDAILSATIQEVVKASEHHSHNLQVLPEKLRNLPWLTPSGWVQSVVEVAAAEDDPSLRRGEKRKARDELGREEEGTTRRRGTAGWPLIGYENEALHSALKNQAKLRGKDRDKILEKETLEDWTHLRPKLSRLLEITDLGLYGCFVLRREDGDSGFLAPAIGEEELRSKLEREIQASYSIDAEASEGEARKMLLSLAHQKIQPGGVEDAVERERKRSVREVAARSGAVEIREKVYGGVMGEAYARSVAEFVGGAASWAAAGEDGDEEETVEPARPWKDERVLGKPLTEWVKERVIRPLTGPLLDVLSLVGGEEVEGGVERMVEEKSETNLPRQEDQDETLFRKGGEMERLLNQVLGPPPPT
ncbi:hypothetical protein IE53DRAFT_326450 [Violaceomyces palustris]|uniref:Uncharacterized protein n=1 Tax=Violaceomyces palustris TaxID=1673888 RepID=A0ACD0P3F3_9BASI|nr:hypothetical protein IE53DRAFT_326450 [Violaceomyces palustris]